MSGQLTSSLPQESEAQRIGRLATKAFQANIPDAWKLDSIEGDNDSGYDFQIQTVDAALTKDVFRVQLKGKTAPELNAAGTTYSVQLDMSTVNYYARATEPILLVLCDLSSADLPKNCKLYYCWIHEELQRVRKRGVAENQKFATFHVPASNKLDANTDLSSDIEQFRRLARIGRQLDVIVEERKPELTATERVALATKIVPSLESRSQALLDSLTDDSSTSWVEAPKGSLQWHIQEARNALRVGDKQRSQILLDASISMLDGARPLEQADYWHALGRLRVFELHDADANIAFDQACKLSNDADIHLIPWAETELRLKMRDSGGPTDLSVAIKRLASSSPTIVGMKARLTAAEGKYKDALAIADNIDGLEKHTAQSIIFSMQAMWKETIDACEKGLAETASLKDPAKLLFVILRARARFSLSIGLGPTTEAEIFLPMNGPAGTDSALLRASWEDISEAVMILRSTGWPGNVDLISDIWSQVASMLGLQKEALPLMAEAGAARPTLPTLQAGIELLAAQTENFKLALEANACQPESDRAILRRISLLHLAHRHKDCIELMLSKGETATSNAPMLGYAMSLAIFSAEKLVRSDLASKWTQMMESNPDLAPFLAMHRYFRAISNKPLAKDAALAELEAQYNKLGSPTVIAKQLFHELDPTRPEDAAKHEELAKELMKEQLLDADEYILLAQALTTLGKWNELLDLSNQALTRFETVDRLIAVGALALDKLGRSAEAHSRLQSLIQKDNPDSLAINTYINIASISGFTQEAIACLENVLANETDNRRKLQCLRHLFSLIHLTEPLNPRLIDIAWEIGQKANQENEAQEGLFLISMFSATLPAEAELSEERKADLQKRIGTFTTRFPNSKILRSFTISEQPSAEELIKTLTDAIGIDEEKIRWRAKIQNELARGVIPVPYAWRPRHILDGIPDLPALWETAKSSRWEHQQFHLTMALSDWTPASSLYMKSHIPLLDLVALLVVHDLGLFDKLFDLYPKIAIGKATLLELQHLLAPMSCSPYRVKCESLLSVLKARFNQIEQPSEEPPEEDGYAKANWPSQEVIAIAKADPRFMIYSDDAIFRIYANDATDGGISISTLDFLHSADEARILDAQTVARHIARLCSWRVGVVIQLRYQFAILPDALGKARSVSDAIDRLRTDELCNALFSGIWNLDKPYMELQGHIGALLRDLAEDPANSIESASAIVGFWHSKVRLHRQSPTPNARLIALAIGQALFIDRPMSEITSQRLWSIYTKLIETVHGPLMDDKLYDESILMIAKVAVENDQAHGLTNDRSLAERLRMGLTDGTSDYGKFVRGLEAANISLAHQQNSRSH